MPRNSTAKYRRQFLDRFKYFNIIIVFRCVSCQQFNSKYIYSIEISLSYIKYIRFLKKYDIKSFSEFNFAKLDKKRIRLNKKLFKISKSINAATAKFNRLTK